MLWNIVKDFWGWTGGKLSTGLGSLGIIAALFTNMFPENWQRSLTWFFGFSIAILSITFIYFLLNKTFTIFVSRVSTSVSEKILSILKTPALGDLESSENNANFSSMSQAETAYRYYAKEYGIGYRSLEVQCVINKDGSARVRRKIHLEAYSRIDLLDTYLLISDQSPNIVNRPDFLELNLLSGNSTLNIAELKREMEHLSVVISIFPPLSKGDELTFEMVETLPVNFYSIGLSNSEMLSRDETDYFGWNINRPTRYFSLDIYFPEFAKPIAYNPEIVFASVSGFPTTQTKHIDPSKLLKPKLIGPLGDQYTLSLNVEHPIINLFYILRWRPSEKEFDPQNTERPDKQDLKLIYLAQVREILIERFSEGELRTLTTDLGVDYEVLPSTGKADIARDLIAYLARRNRVQDLIKLGHQQRPDISWPKKPD